MMNYTTVASVETPGFLAQIREVDWDFEGEVELQWGEYQISSVLSLPRLHERAAWRLPNIRNPSRATLFGLVPPHFPIKFSRAKGVVRALFCQVDPDHFEQLTEHSRWTEDQLLALLRSNDPFCRAALGRIASEILHPGFASVERISSLSTCLLLEIPRLLQVVSSARAEVPLVEWQLRKLREVIQESSAPADLSVVSLAAMCGISGRHLMRGFKAATGTTIHRCIEQVRLERTKRLLEQGDMQVKSIATFMGFSSASHMALAFRKLTGMTPSEYRFISRANCHKRSGERIELSSDECE